MLEPDCSVALVICTVRKPVLAPYENCIEPYGHHIRFGSVVASVALKYAPFPIVTYSTDPDGTLLPPSRAAAAAARTQHDRAGRRAAAGGRAHVMCCMIWSRPLM